MKKLVHIDPLYVQVREAIGMPRNFSGNYSFCLNPVMPEIGEQKKTHSRSFSLLGTMDF